MKYVHAKTTSSHYQTAPPLWTCWGERTKGIGGCAVHQRRCLNTLGFVSPVKGAKGSSVLVCERLLALPGALHLLPVSGRTFMWKSKGHLSLRCFIHWKHHACSTAYFFQVLLWLGEYPIIINSLWKCAFQVIFTELIDIVPLHTAAFFQRWHTAIRNEYDNVTILRESIFQYLK